MKYCIFCGQELLNDAAFCHSCGKKQIASDTEAQAELNGEVEKAASVVPVQNIEEKPKKKVLKGVFPLIKSSILLFLALVMLITAFTPVSVLTYDIDDNDTTLEADIYSSDILLLFFDGFEDGVDKELEYKYNKLTNELSELMEEKGYEYSSEYADLIEEMFKLQLRAAYQTEETTITPMLVCAVIFVIVRFFTVLAFFVLAVLGFVNSFEKVKLGNGKIERISMRLFIYSFLLLILGTFIFNCIFDGLVEAHGSIIFSIVLSVCAIIGLIISTKIIKRRFGNIKKFVYALVSIFLCVLTVALASSTYFTTEAFIDTISQRNILKISSSISLIPVSYLFVIIGALLIISEKIMYLLMDKSLDVTLLIGKIIIPVFCAIALGFYIVISKYIDISEIEAGFIAMLVFAIAAICIPKGKEK